MQPHRLNQALILADRDLQLLGRAQLLETSKARERVAIIAGVKGRHRRRRPITNADLGGDSQTCGWIRGKLAYGAPKREELRGCHEVLLAVVNRHRDPGLA